MVFNETYGAKAATITIHPTVEGLEDVVINATASTLDPDAWTEDFAAGTLPTGWVANNWTIGTYSSYENTTTMALAPGSSTAGTLITPCLTAKAGDVLTWDGYFKWADEALVVEYSNNEQETWTSYETIYGTETGEKGSGQVNYHKGMSFTAPADGNYYLRFTSTYQNGVDNFAGFKLNLPDHIMAITTSSIPASGSYSPTMKEGVSFNATVTVKESRGVEEKNVVAKLYMGDKVIGTSEATTVEANASKEITIVATPTEAATEGAEMYIAVEYAGGTLKTTAETRYVKEIVMLELTQNEEKEITTGYSAVYDIVTLSRTFVEGWNTIVLPVETSVSDYGENAKAYGFTGYTDGELRFSSVTTLNAGTPYLLYLPNGLAKTFTWNEPVIYSSYVGEENIKTTQGGVTFQGTYAPIAEGDLTGKYVVTNESKIGKAGSGASIKGFRAYFDAPAAESGNAPLFISFSDGTTGISMVSGDVVTSGDAIYNLNGQRVDATKMKGQRSGVKRGLYIVGGKKVIF